MYACLNCFFLFFPRSRALLIRSCFLAKLSIYRSLSPLGPEQNREKQHRLFQPNPVSQTAASVCGTGPGYLESVSVCLLGCDVEESRGRHHRLQVRPHPLPLRRRHLGVDGLGAHLQSLQVLHLVLRHGPGRRGTCLAGRKLFSLILYR